MFEKPYFGNEKETYIKLYLECCSLWFRNMDPGRKWRGVSWRRMLKVKWTDRIKNDEVFQMAKEERIVLKF